MLPPPVNTVWLYPKKSIRICIATLLLSAPVSALAVPLFLENWRSIYPSSSSVDRNCQLCHAQANGDEPWNAYGFEIRDAYRTIFGSTDIDSAIRFIEDNDSDLDPMSLSNLQEIEMGLDPGWAPGPNNVWIFKNGDAIGGKLPPFNESRPGLDDETCFPVIGSNKAISLTCF